MMSGVDESMEQPAVVEAMGHIIDVIRFRRAMLEWGQGHFRSFPWRLTRDPYRILIAEVMLHRTQAAQVVPVYEAFLDRYPDPMSLARSSKGDVIVTLSPLGLQWRIDLVRELGRQLGFRHRGDVPRERSDLVSLAGVSDYIASAVRCFAWNLPEALLDTNTVRILGRLLGLEIKDSSRRSRQFLDLLTALVDPSDPRAYNYALLDLGAEVCLGRTVPICASCPVAQWCTFFGVHLGRK